MSATKLADPGPTVQSPTRGAARLALLITLPIALVAGLIAFWGLGGFDGNSDGASEPTVQNSAPVTVAAPSLAPDAATMCLAFIAQLPVHLRNLTQRKVTAGAQQNAAFGDPPIVVSCGGQPVANPPDAFLYVLSGVCWYADQSNSSATVWTTLDRQVPIAISVPSSYQGQGTWIQEFTDPILEAMPSLPQTPAKCVAPSTAPS